ncbi:hypothetical protein [Neoroseomonas lacus]|uniref:Uncharacterized protein n=1 Tax=Neoroseomonas lacus TaxID=287609 RepID=A0A917NWS4_9PROT|nr:hypothetical protein [Neoroseomonas lacus]GGJ35609.1 hypothetical protein GCM10011320_49230 [Neoroseomonas lacus]
MEPAVLSAVSALAGSAIGAFASLATAWVSQRGTHRQQRQTAEIVKREALYVEFMQEAARLLLDSLEHEGAPAESFAGLYALMGRIRLFATPAVTEQAEGVLEHIIQTYAAPNRTFAEIAAEAGRIHNDPLRGFSEACRDELAWVGRG